MVVIIEIIETKENETLLDRLKHSPASLTDEQLRVLMNMSGGARGQNARIAPLAYLEYERRHSPTEANNV